MVSRSRAFLLPRAAWIEGVGDTTSGRLYLASLDLTPTPRYVSEIEDFAGMAIELISDLRYKSLE